MRIWFCQGVDDFQLFPAGVAGNVNISKLFVNDFRVLPHQFVDNVADGFFVAGNGGGGDDDAVTRNNFHLAVIGKGHAVQGGHGFPLASGGDDHHFFSGEVFQLGHFHQGVGRNVHIT